MTEMQGEVFDLGYQHYNGPREGRSRARKAIWKNGVRIILGMGKNFKAKILPVLLFIAVIIPALVLSFVASASGGFGGDQLGPAGYYQIVSIIILLFSAIMAPELLCPDRRDGVITLYLVRPLTATDYIAGRWLAFFSITLILVYSGQVVLFVGYTLAAAEPWTYLKDNWLDIPRFLAAGFILSLFTTTLPMAVSAFTNRRAIAAAIVIGLFIILTFVPASLSEDQCETTIVTVEDSDGNVRSGTRSENCGPLIGDAAKWVALLDISQVPSHVNRMIFNQEPTELANKLVEELPAIVPIAWYILLVVGPGFVLWWRYQRIRL
ncbi:MAG: ABC transporter permease subunit [Chloroflexi bacterium]|nr:ABC transporter permease subunit [Chloroflexota bacterium]